jgi:PKD repeat protein
VPCIKRLVVDNTPAKARFFYTTDSQDEIYTGEIVIFNATLSEDIDGAEDGMIYLWNFGDGFMGTGAICEHVYSKPGIYKLSS